MGLCSLQAVHHAGEVEPEDDQVVPEATRIWLSKKGLAEANGWLDPEGFQSYLEGLEDRKCCQRRIEGEPRGHRDL